MSGPSKITIAVNPFSGRFHPGVLFSVERSLRKHGFRVTVLAGEFSRLKEMSFGEEDYLVVIGGDGSVNMALNALGPGKVPICIIPTGTGNALAKELEIPTSSPTRAVSLVIEGRRRKIDVGTVDGHYFLLMAGAGFDANVAKRVTQKAKRRLKIGGYAISALLEFWRYEPHPIMMKAGDDWYQGVTVLFCNTRTYGGPLTFARRAQIDDGSLDVVVFKKMGLMRIMQYLLMGMGLNLGSIRSQVDYFQSKSVRVFPTRPVPYQADGDYCGFLPQKIGVLQCAQEFFVPA